jgi:hypothetical protein
MLSSDTSENYATKTAKGSGEVTLVSPKVVNQNEKAVTATNNNVKKEEARPVAEAIKTESKSSTQVTAGGISATDIKPVANKDLKLVVDTFYRIQFYVLKKYLPLDTNYYTHLKGYDVVEDVGQFRYLLGKFRSYEECYKYWKTQIQPRYKESIIIKYLDGKRMLE